MPCAFCIIIWMKRKDLASYLILAILIFIAFTFLWNYQTTLPWLKGILMPVAIPMLLGICIGFVLNMPASAIEKRINGVRHCRGISIAVSIILLVLAAVLFLAIVVPELVNAISLLIDALRDLANNQALWDTRLAEIPLIGSFLGEADTQILTIADKIESYISSISPTIISFAISKVGEFISFWITLFISFIFAVYFLANKEMLKKHIKALLSLVMDEKTLSYLSHTAAVSSEAFTRFITAQVTEALIIGVLCFIGMLILRLPYAPVISTLTGVMALIPIYGAVIGALAGAVMIAVINPWQALFFLIFIFVLQQLEGDLIYPRVVGSTTGVPSVYVFASVTIGGTLFGLAGMLFAVPVFSIVFTLLKEVYERRQKAGAE